jgi:shikimate kinase
MSFVFITGASTAGKSTIARELSKLGYAAYDTEQNNMSAWYNKKSGKRVAGLGEIPNRTQKWFDQHEWLISVEQVKNLATQAGGKPIFLCGIASNHYEIRKLCSSTVWLKSDSATIKQRVKLPRDHDWGTRPHELKGAIAGNQQGEIDYQNYGAIMIDATQPLERVIDEILSMTTTR